MANINEPHYDELREHPGFRARRARIGYQLRSERIGLSLWEVDPGQAAYPYHYHLTEEELVVVLDGELTLRTPDGLRPLEPGEVVRFPSGETGGHQIVNDSAVGRPVSFDQYPRRAGHRVLPRLGQGGRG